MGSCNQENVMYRMSCEICLEEGGATASYIGESSRSLFQRSAEHLQGARKGNLRNPIVKHHLDTHPELPEPPGFKVELLRTFQKPLERLVAESVEIETGNYDMVLNSKGEWGGSRLPRLTVEVGEHVHQVDYRGKNQRVRKLGTDLWSHQPSSSPSCPPSSSSSSPALSAAGPANTFQGAGGRTCTTSRQGAQGHTSTPSVLPDSPSQHILQAAQHRAQTPAAKQHNGPSHKRRRAPTRTAEDEVFPMEGGPTRTVPLTRTPGVTNVRKKRKTVTSSDQDAQPATREGPLPPHLPPPRAPDGPLAGPLSTTLETSGADRADRLNRADPDDPADRARAAPADPTNRANRLGHGPRMVQSTIQWGKWGK